MLTVSAPSIAGIPVVGGSFSILTGDTRLACEAVMCLATSKRPSECEPSLRRYFSISHRRLSDTIRDRANFLRQCPASDSTPEMTSFVNALANGAGRCDAASLNVVLRVAGGRDDGDVYISDKLPDYCAAYVTNSYTDLSAAIPKYVGTPERGGVWVEAKDYDGALIAYNARIAAEDAGARLNGR